MKRYSYISCEPAYQHFLMVNTFWIKSVLFNKTLLTQSYKDTLLCYLLEMVLPFTFRALSQVCIFAYVGCISPYRFPVGPMPFTKWTFPITAVTMSVYTSISLYIYTWVCWRFSHLSHVYCPCSYEYYNLLMTVAL